MIDSYSIEIANEKAGTYQTIAFIIGIINCFAFAYVVFSSPGGVATSKIYGLGLILSLLGLISFGIIYFKKSPQRFTIEFFLVPCAIIWMISGAVFPGFLLMAFAFLSFITNNKKIIRFHSAGINYPSVPATVFPWNEIDFVVLKDDILTIETRANRVLQFTLKPDVSDSINPAAFNSFCLKYITQP